MRDWEEFLEQQEQRIGKQATDKWLRSLKVHHFDAGNLYLQAEDSFQAAWFEEHVRPHAEESLRNKNRRKIRVHLSVAAQAPPPKKKRHYHRSQAGERGYELIFDELDPYCTLSSFARTEGTQLAHALLARLCLPRNHTDTIALGTYNPIFIHGAAGSGKSHLLMATARELNALGRKTIYARGNTFTEHVVGAIRGGGMQVFRAAYRNIDCLLIDDLQILSNKVATQEELFHTFNTLHVAGKQLILAANCSPQELRAVEPRLVSRFEWGLTTALHPPSPKEMSGILESKAKAMQFELPPEIRAFLLETWQAEPKGLIQALEALVLRTHLQPARTAQLALKSVAGARGVLHDLIEKKQTSTLTPERVIESVASFYGIEVQDILGKSQRRECSLPRQLSMYLCRSALNLPFTRIGDIFSRNHSTVMTGVRQIESRLTAGDAELPAIVKRIRMNF